MSKFVYSNSDCLAQWHGGAMVTLRRGDVWDAEDPFVQSRPDLFSTTPVVVHNTTNMPQPEPAPVETAMRRPGQKRTTTRG